MHKVDGQDVHVPTERRGIRDVVHLRHLRRARTDNARIVVQGRGRGVARLRGRMIGAGEVKEVDPIPAKKNTPPILRRMSGMGLRRPGWYLSTVMRVVAALRSIMTAFLKPSKRFMQERA